MSTLILGGGCFWCTEAIFQRIHGVTGVMPGYAGGTTPNPRYEEVCLGTTGHAEVIQIEYDPSLISYRDLLDIFFHTHDPTTLNAQGNDIGTQYRSIVFYGSEEEKRIAEEIITELEKSGTSGKDVVTELQPAGTFFPAEDYHLNYFNTNGAQPYCSLVIAPKIEKFLKKYPTIASK
jgi:peptide-methionine (S)-S-oxide reductase